MLKRRIAATVVVKDGIVVQSINFKKYLPVGKPHIAVEFLNTWGIDEIVLIDISASKSNHKPAFELVKEASASCYVPLTVGGGIKSLDDITTLMHCGADKISLNQAAIYHPSLITEAAHTFGDQCVVASIDAIRVNNEYRVYDYVKNRALDLRPAEFAMKLQELGAGEILITSVDRDGTYQGYDVELINEICNKVSIPVMCCGGAKNALDLIAVFKGTKVSAASAANFYHFTEHSVNITKRKVKEHVDVRLETYADYSDNILDESLRLTKKSDQCLEDLLYLKIEKEVI